jgi:hypothetical protein
LQAALAELEHAGTRPYYDAEADARAREQYYDGIDPDQPAAAQPNGRRELAPRRPTSVTRSSGYPHA